jgi:2-succinyl-5-enolpyruvyl-6-hydroxy-3-cyclohexene-1-carboxylate synthase
VGAGRQAYSTVVRSPERAQRLLAALVSGGAREVVLCPGSRSAGLAVALYAADAAGDLRLHVRVDERSAGFLALGLAAGSRAPVAVVTTSGTAVGNLLPAVMEAAHSGRRLVVLTADRPASMRGTGANQTTQQDGIFGVFAPCFDLAADAGAADLAAAAEVATRRRGPTQLNVQLEEPLLPDTHPWWPATTRPAAAEPEPRQWDTGGRRPGVELLRRGPRTVVVAGDDSGSAARVLAERAGWPLLAEPTSGARVGANAVRTYRLLL